MKDDHEAFMRRAIELARQGVENDLGGPFGCVIVRDGEVVGEGCNEVTSTNDPTAHAEITAIRAACRKLNSYQLTGCTVYTSCEPCPMCLGAIYWARPSAIYFAGTREDAAAAGFDDELFYDEMDRPNDERQLKLQPMLRSEVQAVFEQWVAKSDKVEY